MKYIDTGMTFKKCHLVLIIPEDAEIKDFSHLREQFVSEMQDFVTKKYGAPKESKKDEPIEGQMSLFDPETYHKGEGQ